MSLDYPNHNEKAASNSDLKIALICARYNIELANQLLNNTTEALNTLNVRKIKTNRVPGSAELPFAVSLISLNSNFDAIIALGVIIAGKTNHHSIIAHSNALAFHQIATERNIPIINGTIVTNSKDEAIERCNGKINRGKEFAEAAIEIAKLKNRWTQKTN